VIAIVWLCLSSHAITFKRYLWDDITLELIVELLRKLGVRDDEQVCALCVRRQTACRA
jgi:hypothetical protein